MVEFTTSFIQELLYYSTDSKDRWIIVLVQPLVNDIAHITMVSGKCKRGFNNSNIDPSTNATIENTMAQYIMFNKGI